MSDDLAERVACLEAEVERLRERVDELEGGDAPTGTDGSIDHYDATVLQRIEQLSREPTPREVRHYYEEAGIRDLSKIKQRHKFLKRSGRIADAVAREVPADV